MQVALAVLDNNLTNEDFNQQLIRLWLHGKSRETQRAYSSDAKKFLESVNNKPLAAVTMADLQEFTDTLDELAPNSRNRIISSVKSLLTFGSRIGVLRANVGAPVRVPSAKNTLAERILSEADVHKMLALEINPRNHVLLRLLYAGGLRVSELCGLRWRDVQDRDNAGQITVYGKGGKTRAILLSVDTWNDLCSLRNEADADSIVFQSRKKKGPLDPTQVRRIVRTAAKRAGLTSKVSPHWLRHAHASHALDRGAPIHLVQTTLGHSSVATTGKYLHARPNDSSARYLSI